MPLIPLDKIKKAVPPIDVDSISIQISNNRGPASKSSADYPITNPVMLGAAMKEPAWDDALDTVSDRKAA